MTSGRAANFEHCLVILKEKGKEMKMVYCSELVRRAVCR